MLDWCGGAFDPTAFRLDHINTPLRQFKLDRQDGLGSDAYR